jgi:TctA family transporter
MSNGNWLVFVERPIALVLLIVCALLLSLSALSLLPKRRDWRARLAQAEAGDGTDRG